MQVTNLIHEHPRTCEPYRTLLTINCVNGSIHIIQAFKACTRSE